VNTWVVLSAAYPVVHLVHPLLPVGVVVLLQNTLKREKNYKFANFL
jgi:hypothetical protein